MAAISSTNPEIFFRGPSPIKNPDLFFSPELISGECPIFSRGGGGGGVVGPIAYSYGHL